MKERNFLYGVVDPKRRKKILNGAASHLGKTVYSGDLNKMT